MARILSIGPEPTILAERNRALAGRGHRVRGAARRAQAFQLARSEAFDFVLLCNEFPNGYAGQLAEDLRPLVGHAEIVCLPSDGIEMSAADIDEMIRSSSRAAA